MGHCIAAALHTHHSLVQYHIDHDDVCAREAPPDAHIPSVGYAFGAIGAVFGWQSLYITLMGAAGGALLGMALCELQSRYGLLRMAGDEAAMVVHVYPVHFMWGDLLVAGVPVLVIGGVTAWIASAFARSRIVETRQ